MSKPFDTLNLHRSVIAEYQEYVKSFIQIKDDRIRSKVEAEMASGRFWPPPLVQFNPSFAKGSTLDDLVRQKKVHTDLTPTIGNYKLHAHQIEAIELGVAGKGFVVTSGTGSGKSLTFLATIFDHLFKNPQAEGVQAVIVYPMNALINSQNLEIGKYKKHFESETRRPFPITYKQYTGQESDEEKDAVKTNPPNILLTNYMMLELLLTRHHEKGLREAIFRNLRFLAYDELHTYRGRQGADVALLNRRIKAACRNSVITIGTSATMVTGGSLLEQKKQVAKTAQDIFGAEYAVEQVIQETLAPSLDPNPVLRSADKVRLGLKVNIRDLNATSVCQFPLACWLENEAAVEEKEGRLIRRAPLTFPEIIERLGRFTGVEKSDCAKQLEILLDHLSAINQSLPEGQPKLLPFKLHQFIAQTGTVYSTLEDIEKRIVTLEPGYSIREGEKKKILFPLAFSRWTGQEFYCVSLKEGESRFEPRDFRDESDEDDDSLEDGYLFFGENLWDPDVDEEELPDSWFKEKKDGTRSRDASKKHRFPRKFWVNAEGECTYLPDPNFPLEVWFMTARLLFDPSVLMPFDGNTREFTKMTRLGSEGRSTSTTIVSLAIIKHLANNGQEYSDQKLLSFMDNRQDAALQSGHFNDFILTTRLRASLWRALSERKELRNAEIASAVFSNLKLDINEYSQQVVDFPAAVKEREDALKDVLYYRLLYDLRHGWRVVAPNLEQCGLLKISYTHLEANCAKNEAWKANVLLDALSQEERRTVIQDVLDYFRRAYAIHHSEYLDEDKREARYKIINSLLKIPWTLEKDEGLNHPVWMRAQSMGGKSRLETQSAGLTSALGRYLQDRLIGKGFPRLRRDEYPVFVEGLFELLAKAGWLRKLEGKAGEKHPALYRLNAETIVWTLGDGAEVSLDRVRVRARRTIQPRSNPYFQKLYRFDFDTLKPLRSGEHTGQISTEDRKQREKDFRDGHLSALYCSPTMELGIDIANLNVVHLRNVPPSPSNYAQRAGRAGRSGQGALIITHCALLSNHDRHFFDHKTEMVSGQVDAPRIDLTQRELFETHLRAIYLSHKSLPALNKNIGDLLELDPQGVKLLSDIGANLSLDPASRKSILDLFRKAITDLNPRLEHSASWFHGEWLEQELERSPLRFKDSLSRWHTMYYSAKKLRDKALKTLGDDSLDAKGKEKNMARIHEKQAAAQINLLQNKSEFGAREMTEFYPFRYLASEGFLPGYNFTRLPLRAFLAIGDAGEYVSRPRAVALREFGPRNIIYHKGQKFRMSQLMTRDLEGNLKDCKISVNTGYLLMDEEYSRDTDPLHPEVSLADTSQVEIVNHVLEMGESRATPVQRISCEEEDRISQGFAMNTYFRMPGGMQASRESLVKIDGEVLLRLRFLPAAELLTLNRKWRRNKEPGFFIGSMSGFWKSQPKDDEPKDDNKEKTLSVKLFTRNTADALYIEPVAALKLAGEGVITLQYALLQAVKEVFRLEPDEIKAELLGGPENPNILLFEAAEGSLGVLSQFAEKAEIFPRIVEAAWKACRFDEPEYREQASYKDLLSYYNQRDHKKIDRFKIQAPLKLLRKAGLDANVSPDEGGRAMSARINVSYDDQYQFLVNASDPDSKLERHFLEKLHQDGLKLPDKAQYSVPGVYVQADFFYEPDVAVFCDGSVHDNLQLKESDAHKRETLKSKGIQVVVWRYDEDWKSFLSRHTYLFFKVRR